MSQKPALSVVVPVFRGWDDVVALLEPFADADDVEVVVVDDASGDDGARRLAARFSDARVQQRARNGGFAAAVNTGVVASRAPVIAVLNSDLRIGSQDLRRLTELAAAHPDWIVGPHTVDGEGNDLPVARRPRTLVRVVADYVQPVARSNRLSRMLRDPDLEAQAADAPRPTGWLAGSCLVFSRQVWSTVGPLDERFYMDSEEVDWQLRASRVGIRPHYVPTVTATHAVGHGLRPGTPTWERRFRLAWAGRRRFVRKHVGLPGVVLFQIGLTLGFLANVPLWLRDLRHRPGDEVRVEVRAHLLALLGR